MSAFYLKIDAPSDSYNSCCFSVIQVQESLIACAKQQSQQLKFCRELASAVAKKASGLAGKNNQQTPVSAQ